MQFDLQVDVDKPAVKVAALSRLWEACYGGQPGLTGNHLGRVIEMLRRQFPQLTKELFNRELGNIIDQTYDEMERLLPDLQADLRSHLAKCKILCLATVPNSLLMWYCYAEKCSGIALRFKCAPELDSPWPTALPINYLANMPRLVDNEFLADMLSGRVSLDHKSILHKMVYTKSIAWAYEREWRIFSGEGRDPSASFEDIKFDALELDAVIFGYRTPEKDRTAFSEIIRRQYPHVQILQLRKTALIYFRLEIVAY
jgi:hypothetical protein